tara:strand:- start:544 stop:909 length:366 start_codon:yes stop_codon:yes gene_type:complete
MAILATAMLFTGQAIAADPGSSAVRYLEVENDDLTVPGIELRVGQVEGMEIVNAQGEVIGTVDDILSGADGQIVAISTEVGGFLGIGDREVILGLDQIALRDGRLATQLTNEQLEKLPHWD